MMTRTKTLATVMTAIGCLTAGQAMSTPLFSDDYSSDTSANYDVSAGGVWGIAGGDLDYSRTSGDNAWRTDSFVVKDSSYSHANDANVVISGQFTVAGTASSDRGQVGLVVGADAQSPTDPSGFMVYAVLNGELRFFSSDLFAGSFQALADDGGRGDQIGDGVLDQVGTWTVNVTFDRVNSTTVGNVLVDVEVIAPDATVYSESYDVLDQANANQVGWRNRINSDAVAVSFDNLSVTAVPEPGSLLLLGGGAMLAMTRRR